MKNILWFHEIRMTDLPQVGGKNASLGEMVSNLSQLGIMVPPGFATTANAYRRFLEFQDLRSRIALRIATVEVEDISQLSRAGAEIRGWIEQHPLPPDLEGDIRDAFDRSMDASTAQGEITWAVRSSATAEDLPDASFAGQQETFLNIGGVENVIAAVRKVFASLYNDRAIAYRVHHGFDHDEVALSAGIQRMVRSDLGASGVMFTIDTETGFDEAVFVTSSYGLGEAVVQGAVNPDEFYVSKPALRAGRPAVLRRSVGAKAVAMRYTESHAAGNSTAFFDVPQADRIRLSLTDPEVEQLAHQALVIEAHYGRPMDIEWGKDGVDGGLYILQARPETVVSRSSANVVRRFRLLKEGDMLAEGRSVGQRIGSGPARVLADTRDMKEFRTGDVLVADMTDPDWEPIMKRASAIVTNRGGRTCHAAIIARELGIPAVVGTGDATTALRDAGDVTVSCAAGDVGRVYAGRLDFVEEETHMDQVPDVPVRIMLNIGAPDQAFSFARLPHRGVGLARLEFIINRQIGIHPRALLEYDGLPARLREEIAPRIAAYDGPRDFFVRRVAEGVSMLAAAFSPEPVIVRMSDFKSNEYANLVGGRLYEPHEENPMLGYRGAARYLSSDFRACFAMECEAIRFVREEMGFTNVEVMIPFVRTVQEASEVLDLLAANGLRRGEHGLRVIMMCELPANALLADNFLEYFDGFSIGSNDLTQLTLGVDRDSALVAGSFDERDPAVLKLIGLAIDACKRRGKYVGICGQGPSDHPGLAEWLVSRGIDSLSLNPDSVVDTWLRLGAVSVVA